MKTNEAHQWLIDIAQLQIEIEFIEGMTETAPLSDKEYWQTRLKTFQIDLQRAVTELRIIVSDISKQAATL